MNTAGYGGRTLSKNILVYTNDNTHSRLSLTVSGTVDKYVTLDPKKVFLNGFAGTQIKKTVRIIPEEKYPFKIVESKARNGEFIRYELREEKSGPVTIYLLTVENLKKEAGRYSDTILLKTDSDIRPAINVPVEGNINVKKSE